MLKLIGIYRPSVRGMILPLVIFQFIINGIALTFHFQNYTVIGITNIVFLTAYGSFLTKTGFTRYYGDKNLVNVFGPLSDLVVIFDTKGIIQFVNQAFINELHRPYDWLTGKNLQDMMPEADRDGFYKSISEVKMNGNKKWSIFLITHHGNQVQMDACASLIRWGGKRCILCFMRDEKGQLQMLEQLTEREQRFREMTEMFPEMLCETDETGKILYTNKAAYTKFGYSGSDVEKGLQMLHLIAPEEVPRARKNLQARLKDPNFPKQEYLARKKDGEKFPVLVQTSPVFKKNALKGYRGVMIDISDRKQKEKELNQAYSFTKQIIENIPVGIAIFNELRDLELSNHMMDEIFELDFKKFGKKDKAYETIWVKSGLQQLLRRVMQGNKTVTENIKITNEYDETKWLSVTGLPSFIENCEKALLIFSDITHQVQYENELKDLNMQVSTQNMIFLAQNEEIKRINKLLKDKEKNIRRKSAELEMLTHNIDIQVWYLQRPDLYGAVNKAHAQFLGKTLSQVKHKNVAKVVNGNHLHHYMDLYRRVFSDKKEVQDECWLTNANGKERLIQLKMVPHIHSKSGQVEFVVCSGIDITEQRIAEEKLNRNLQQQEFLSSISSVYNSLDDIQVITKKALGQMGEHAHITRVTIFESTDQPHVYVCSYEWHQPGQNGLKQKYPSYSLSDYPSLSMLLSNKNGAVLKEDDTLNDDLHEFLRNRRSKSMLAFPIQVNHKVNGFICFEENVKNKIWEQDEVELFRIIVNQINNSFSKKKILDELQEAKDTAEQANNLKSLFLANVSHEIRTPMNAILGYAQLLSKKGLPNPLDQYVNIIYNSGNNLLALLNDILDLSKIEAGKLKIENKPLLLHTLLDEIKDIFKLKAAEKNLTFNIDVDGDLPASLVLDQTRLRQILFNLVGNAVKFTEVGFVMLSVQKTRENPETNTIDITIQVEDTGIGISGDQLAEIFNSFQQQLDQSSKYGGTGLGLAITKKLVEMLNGKIMVTSKVGEGSVFKVDLVSIPVVHAANVENQNPMHVPEIWFGHQLVMVVEDNPVNALLIKTLLEDHHLDTIHAANGKEALNLLRHHHPDIILLDMKMPVMDGFETLAILRTSREWHRIPVIATSAQAMKEDEDKIRQAGCDAFIPKPIEQEKLIQQILGFLKAGSITKRKKQFKHQKEMKDWTEQMDRMALNQELISKLTSQWEINTKSMQLDKWKEFGNTIKEIGRGNQLQPLVMLGDEFIESVRLYDIKRLKSIINKFPVLVGHSS